MKTTEKERIKKNAAQASRGQAIEATCECGRRIRYYRSQVVTCHGCGRKWNA